MGHAYTPGLRVTGRTLMRKKRILPIQGDVMVKVGQIVNSDTVIARTELTEKASPALTINKTLAYAPIAINAGCANDISPTSAMKRIPMTTNVKRKVMMIKCK